MSNTLSKKPVITVTGGGLSDEATEGEKALVEAGVQIYQRSGALVRPVISEVDASDDRRTKVASLVRTDLHYLRDQLCRIAEWEKYDARSQKMKRINPPAEVAQIILSRIGEWSFPSAVGIITTPTMRPDGSLLTVAGYDAQTRLILLEPPPMPAIPERPTKEEAIKALALINSLFDEFPFVLAVDRSVALSTLLTTVARGAFTVAPMHAITAPTAGTGKSFVLDTASAVAIGQICPIIAAGRNEEETEKRLGAALLAGQQIVSIDNFNGDLGGDALCQAIERPVVNIRVLGKSQLMRIESRSTLFANGNNLRLVADMTRRVVLCRLDAEMERPESRQFSRNPVAEVLADRGKYIAAALTVVRAYIVAGRPNTARRLASFEGWSDTIRSALIWLGWPDPVQSMETVRMEDPSFQKRASVFKAIREVFGANNPVIAAEIVQQALEKDSTQDANALTSLKNPELRAALVNAVGDKTGFIDTRELGKYLARNKGCIACGLRLEGKSDDHGHPATWWLKDAAGAVESGSIS